MTNPTTKPAFTTIVAGPTRHTTQVAHQFAMVL